jgi:hypothetical protein
MKLKIILSLAALIAIAGLLYGYQQMSKERTNEARGEKPVTAESKVERATNAGAILNLDEKAQKLMGLETTLLSPATLASEIKCYGRVLDSSPLLGLVSNLASARAALDASGKECQRVKTLFNQGENASARALEAAEAAMKRDQIALQTAEAQLVCAWGQSVAGQPDLPAFVQALSTLQKVLVRLDLPAGEMTTETPMGARLVVPGTNQPLVAGFLGQTTVTDPQVQGQGFLFEATNTPARLSPGLAITGYLQLPNELLRGVIVPEAAVVRTAGRAWVYVQTGPATFTRRDLNQEHPVADGWFVTGGVTPNDRVVTTGAQTLLSEERKTEIKTDD